MLFLTIVALFLADVRVLFFDKTADLAIDIVLIFTMARPHTAALVSLVVSFSSRIGERVREMETVTMARPCWL